MTYDIWTYQVDVIAAGKQPEITGFRVEAMDGSIGKINEATYETGSSYLVVDTGPWIFGKKVMLPAGVIDRVDLDEEIVYLNRTKVEIRESPEFDETKYRDEAYQAELGDYYNARRY